MATWPCSSGPRPARTGPWSWSSTTPTATGEYAYDRDPILGAGTDQLLAAAAEGKWTVVDMAADWTAIHPPAS